jgi:flagellar basal-body rod modification protein FlgD
VTAAITATSPSPAPATTIANRADQFGKDTFLKLLVAQLKFQNPLAPSDPSSFMTQTAQFSMVEKLEAMATSTTALLNEQRWTAATSMLGRTVSWDVTDATGELTTKSGVVTGIKAGNGSAGPTLLIGDTEVPSSAVTRVTTSAPSTSAT